MTQFARDGYTFYRVLTPYGALEYELLTEGGGEGDDPAKWEELRALADRQETYIYGRPYSMSMTRGDLDANGGRTLFDCNGRP